MQRNLLRLHGAPKGKLRLAPTFQGIAGLIAVSLFTEPCAAHTSLTVGNVRGYPGTTVSVPAALRQGSNAVAAQFEVVFNAAKVSANEVPPGASLANHIVRSREIAPGVRRVLIYSLSNASFPSNGFTAGIPFSVSATEHVGSGPITPGNAIITKADATALAPVTLNSGTIFVQPVHQNEDGTVQFFLPSTVDQRYLIQATTNFVHWDNIATNLAVGSFMDLVDMDAPNFPYRFYRSALFDAIIGGQIGSFFRSADGTVAFQITGLEGRNYTVQASTDLVNWTDIGAATTTAGTIQFTDPNAASFRQRFYRLKSAP